MRQRFLAVLTAAAITLTLAAPAHAADTTPPTAPGTGTAAVNNWSLAWAFANGQQILNLWQGSFVQTGGNVTVTNLSYNATIPAGGGSQAFGFLGTSSAVNTNPNAFTLNGRPCQAV